MIQLFLRRYGHIPGCGTFGILTIVRDGETVFLCFTVEKSWLNNLPYISCIPAGQYRMKPQRYNRGEYDAYEICDVEDRTHILLHIANRASELQGCIAPGDLFGVSRGQWAVLNSRITFNQIMDILDGEECSLDITWTYHPEAL